MLGFALATGWDWWKERRTTKEQQKRVRLIISQEIQYNVQFLQTVFAAMQQEQRKYQETLRNEFGSVSSEGNPIGLLLTYHFTSLSRTAWESQMAYIASAL